LYNNHPQLDTPVTRNDGFCKSIAFLLLLTAAKGANSACPPALDYHKRPLSEEQTVHLCEVML
jgi:hypothetical protein